MSKIPSNREVQEWYNEALIRPSYIIKLDQYEKDKLKDYTINKIRKTFERAIGCLELWGAENYPKDLPEDKRLHHILFVNMEIKEPIYILNLLGWNWTLESSFFPIDDQSTEKPDISSHKVPKEGNEVEPVQIVIDENIQQQLLHDLSRELKTQEQFSTLENLLKGEKVGHERIILKVSAQQLIGVFVNMKKGGNYLNDYDQEDIARWLARNFSYKHKKTKKFRPISYTTARNAFSPSKEDYLPAKKDEISGIR